MSDSNVGYMSLDDTTPSPVTATTTATTAENVVLIPSYGISSHHDGSTTSSPSYQQRRASTMKGISSMHPPLTTTTTGGAHVSGGSGERALSSFNGLRTRSKYCDPVAYNLLNSTRGAQLPVRTPYLTQGEHWVKMYSSEFHGWNSVLDIVYRFIAEGYFEPP